MLLRAGNPNAVVVMYIYTLIESPTWLIHEDSRRRAESEKHLREETAQFFCHIRQGYHYHKCVL